MKRALILRALLGATALLALAAVGTDSRSNAIRSVADSYYASAAQIAGVTGRDSTMDYYQRLLDDLELLGEAPPKNYPADSWRRSIEASSDLDVSLAQQLLQRSFRPMATIRGLGETFVRSSSDGTMQPVAVYVPRRYAPDRPAALVLFLHGRLQAESHLLAPPFIEDLAERTGTIVVAPYGRGRYDFGGAESDVYDAFDAANRAFTIDSHRRFLAGYSMGGFSAFKIAPIRPHDWSAVMCIAGSLLASRAARLTASMSNARFYIVTGARDDDVPTTYPTATAVFLRQLGLSVTFYSQPDGTHSLYSLRSILSRAWADMDRGVVRLPIGLAGDGTLPEAVSP
jgi:predicted esterase